MPIAPRSEDELMQRALALAGTSLLDIANQYHIPIPDNLNKEKGWVGELLEVALGATASTLPEPDFQYIGVELKTLPLNRNNKPKESTYVCTAPLNQSISHTWEQSLVKKKLNRVLWVPVEAENSIPLKERKVYSALLWSPNQEEETILKSDWLEIMDPIWLGELETISSYHGTYLQLRPKAAHAKSLCDSINTNGELVKTLPRGFYLRTQFTNQILSQYYFS